MASKEPVNARIPAELKETMRVLEDALGVNENYFITTALQEKVDRLLGPEYDELVASIQTRFNRRIEAGEALLAHLKRLKNQ